jgi:hypothetical protein
MTADPQEPGPRFRAIDVHIDTVITVLHCLLET